VDQLPEVITPEVVRQTLSIISADKLMIVIIDEFDRLQEASLRALFADTIKTLSDHAIPVTLVLVGVADTVDALIKEHHSIERALVHGSGTSDVSRRAGADRQQRAGSP